MTSKERAELRGKANGLDTVYYVGKEEIGEALVKGIGEALKARELIKIKVQENAMYTAKEAAAMLAQRLGAEVVQVIGGRFVLYKRNKKLDQYGIR